MCVTLLASFIVLDNPEQYQLLVEGACLSSLHESETGVDVVRVNRVGSVDSQILPDQPDPITLKTNLSFRMQGITTSRILALRYIVVRETGNGCQLISHIL